MSKRGILTMRERGALADNATDNYRYNTRTYPPATT
jgi:hypothetical protein